MRRGQGQGATTGGYLLPAEVRVTIDDTYQVGLVSVGWQGHGRFHLPADWTIEG